MEFSLEVIFDALDETPLEAETMSVGAAEVEDAGDDKPERSASLLTRFGSPKSTRGMAFMLNEKSLCWIGDVGSHELVNDGSATGTEAGGTAVASTFDMSLALPLGDCAISSDESVKSKHFFKVLSAP